MRTEMTYCKNLFYATCYLALFGLAAVSLVSCGTKDQNSGPECLSDEDCPPGFRCFFGRCIPDETDTDTDTDDRNIVDTNTGTDPAKDSESATSEETDTDIGCQDPKTDCPDDGNPCTEYVCKGLECELQIRNGEPCTTDTNPCTDEICVQDRCTAYPLDAVPCELDGNDCTRDVCTAGVCKAFELDGTPCNYDSNPCTEDICRSGVCSTTPLSGTTCVFDNEECTTDICEAGVCVAVPLTGPTCNDDGNECTLNACQDGVCKTTKLTGTSCTFDDNECTHDRCVDGECTPRKLTLTRCGPLDNFCMEDVCIEGTCGNPRSGQICNADDNICTSDICNVSGECEATPLGAGASCDDGLKCSGYLVCDDDNSCGPAGGMVPCPQQDCKETTCTEPDPGESPRCQSTNLTGTSCDNGLFCDGEEICNDGICEASAAACDDLNPGPCETVVCDEVNFCQVTNHEDNTPCPDGNLCDGNEICLAGECASGPRACETGSECVTQECTDLGDSIVCGDTVVEPDGTVCVSSNACYGKGTQLCLEGTCTHGEDPVCEPENNDGSFCTKYFQCVPEFDGPDCKFLDKQDTPHVENVLSCEGDDEGSPSHIFSTGFSNNEVENYQGCGNNFTGGEAGYLVSVAPNAPFTVNLTTTHTTRPGEDLYLLHVIDPCNTQETNCSAMGLGSISSTADEDGKAFIVIDGKDSNRGNGTISLVCP